MSIGLMVEVLDCYHGPHPRKLWLLAWAEKVGNGNGSRAGYCSREVLANRLGVSPTRVSNIARELEGEGVLKRLGGGVWHQSAVFELQSLVKLPDPQGHSRSDSTQGHPRSDSMDGPQGSPDVDLQDGPERAPRVTPEVTPRVTPEVTQTLTNPQRTDPSLRTPGASAGIGGADQSLRPPGASAGSGVEDLPADNKDLAVTRAGESLDFPADESWVRDEPEPDDGDDGEQPETWHPDDEPATPAEAQDGSDEADEQPADASDPAELAEGDFPFDRVPVLTLTCDRHGCGGRYLNDEAGWVAHRAVFGHAPVSGDEGG